ncbi:MAG: PAS domain S-box protein [Rhodocyclaceae bacterium]|nr:PAS domain S-box protein [Rhodocyclaceae bacterium]
MARPPAPDSPAAASASQAAGGILRVVLLYAAFAAAWIVVSDQLVARLSGDAQQYVVASTLKGLLFVGATSLFLLVVLQRFAAPPATLEPDAGAAHTRRRLIVIFAILALSIAAIGGFSYRTLAGAVEDDERRDLMAVADLKGKQVEGWLQEIRADIDEQVGGSLFSDAFLSWQAGHEAAARARLLARLELTRHVHGYAAIEIFDPAGRLLLAVGEPRQSALDIPALLARAGQQDAPVLVDFQRRGAAGGVRLAYVGALRADAPAAPIEALVVYSIDPAQRLYPMIQSWPRPSASGESILVRREGDEVVFLNELRHAKNGPFGLHFPLSRTDLPAVQAILHGPGVYEGTDYRDVPVFAAIQAIAGTPWFVLAKIDQTEVFADVQRLAAVTLILTLATIAACGLLLALAWRQQRLREALAREQAVKQSEARYRFLFGNMLEGFAYCRMIFVDGRPDDFVYLDVNPAFERLTGLKDVTGRRIGEIAPGIRAASPALFEAYGRVAQGGPPEQFEMLVEPLGQWFSIAAYAAEPGCFVAVFDVVTERKTTEMQLENERSRLRTLVQTIPDLIWLKNPDGVYLSCNAEFERFFGAPEAVIVGKTDYDFVPKELADFFRQKDREALAAGKPSRNEEWINYASDGHRALLEVIKTPMRDASGRLIGVLGIGRDITARRATEEQLRKLWLAVEQSPNSVIIADLDAHIEYVNAACAAATGYSREELIGQNPRILQSGETPQRTYEALWAALSAGKQWQGEFINKRKSGELYVEFARASPVRQPDGRITHYLMVKEDVTEKKRMGAELDQHRFHLEELVVERTAQLAAAREAAEVANRAKGSFVANMSHEIRTPLNAIVGFTHLLQRHSRDPDQLDKLARIDEAAQHLLSVINDILDFSKIEAGKISLELRDFELDSVLQSVCALVRDKAQAKGLELVIDSDPALVGVLRGDPTRLAQALLNYASNAVKFSSGGAVVLRARRVEESADNLLVRFSVQDNGIGIDAAAQARLFADFEQADQSTTRKYGGTGLGLSITRRLAELMGGEVGVDSQPGVGSTFSFTARLARSSAAAVPRPHESLAGKRILVADDLAEARTALGDMLGGFGLAVTRADSVTAAAAAVETADRAGEPFALALVDAGMTDGAGADLAKLLRAMPLAQLPTLLLLAADDAAASPAAARQAGFGAVLVKPLTASALYDALLGVLDDGGGRDTFGAPSSAAAEQLLARDYGGSRLLLAEDNRINREVAMELLQEVGFRVDLAENGAEAVAMAGQGAYDLILMDVHMPVMDGLAAARAVRALPQHGVTPIIALTAGAFDEDRQGCLDAGMNDHVAKPVDADKLFAALLKWLPKRAATPASAAAPPAAAGAAAPLPEIDGLDTAFGLQTVRGRVATYLRLLRLYAATHADDMTTLRQCLKAGDHETAMRVAHSLKGASAMMGAARVQALAAELDQALREHGAAAVVDSLASATEKELGQLVAAIRAAVPDEPAAAPTTADRPQDLLARLDALLAEDNIEASRAFRSAAPQLRAALGPAAAVLERQIGAYDYAAALATLRAAGAAAADLK